MRQEEVRRKEGIGSTGGRLWTVDSVNSGHALMPSEIKVPGWHQEGGLDVLCREVDSRMDS